MADLPDRLAAAPSGAFGGNVYDRGVDGSECRWGRVLAYQPPNRVVIGWDISPRWQIETDLTKTSEVEVRDGVAADQGWPLYLRRYVEQLTV